MLAGQLEEAAKARGKPGPEHQRETGGKRIEKFDEWECCAVFKHELG